MASTRPQVVHRRWRRRGEMPVYVLFLAPAVLFLSMTSLYPLLRTFWLSFHEWFMNQPKTSPQWVGLGMYRETLADSVFRASALHTAVFGFGTVTVELVLGLALALALTQGRGWVKVARSVLLIPMIMTPVVVGVLWRILLFDKGLVNYLLGKIGIGPILWFVEPRWAFAGVMLVDIWQWTPFVMIVMTAAITALPSEPYRAPHGSRSSASSPCRYSGQWLSSRDCCASWMQRRCLTRSTC
jgi:multiple sugar transport system permease protein